MEPEWSKYWPNLDSQLQARREETKKETDGELFLIEHIVTQFYKGEKYTTKVSRKVFPNWRHDGRRKRLLESEKCSRTRNFSSHRGFDDDICVWNVSLCLWLSDFRSFGGTTFLWNFRTPHPTTQRHSPGGLNPR